MGEDSHAESLTVVLQEILDAQAVTNIQELDCSQVKDTDFERLGDSYMESNQPGEAHIAMDRMMGGEGSDSLKDAHIQMGSSYLGCNSNSSYGYMGSGMMGRGYMMDGTYSSSSMMNYGIAKGFSLFHLVTWIAVLAFFVSGTYYFLKRANKK